MDKLIINAAITGNVPTKADNPNVPVTEDEIVEDVKRCLDAGASIVHIHARDGSGSPTYKKEIYGALFRRIKAECPDVIISGTTSGRVYKELWQRAEVLEPGPELGSLTLGSMNFPGQASVNEPETIKALAALMREMGVVPELEIFELGMAEYAHYLLKKGVLQKPLYGNIILGSLGTMAATPQNLAGIVRELPEGMVWSAGGIGRFQFQMNSLAVVMGGHVRAGLEDSLYYGDGKREPATNAGLVEQVVRLARAYGREPATPDEARAIIGLKEAGRRG